MARIPHAAPQQESGRVLRARTPVEVGRASPTALALHSRERRQSWRPWSMGGQRSVLVLRGERVRSAAVSRRQWIWLTAECCATSVPPGRHGRSARCCRR
ncbi:hypothetical protein PsYK624_065190 [Phanerochaete sordida]|uniref:Uncharacterized protein n=1 Tax=Phanerochaete sordida TaxID=48140 RepID=A0A9P3LDI3_9APHY|nr:hypothetical protein PsYK624_065190 [Phanerochaete sordida]